MAMAMQGIRSSLLLFLTVMLLVGRTDAAPTQTQTVTVTVTVTPPSKSMNMHIRSKTLRGGAVTRKPSAAALSTRSTSTSNRQQQSLPTVQAVLVPRKVNLLTVIQSASLGCLLLSLLNCLLTAGSPYIESIWQELHLGDMPQNYKPLSWELILTRHLTLPPPFLPPVQPLLCALASLVAYVGFGLLLPKWFQSSYERVLKYKHYYSSTSSALDDDTSTAVLVKLPREMRVYTDNKALLVCPLKQQQLNGKKKKAYFDVCHQRYYYHTNNASVTFGAPTLSHDSIKSLLQKQKKGLVGKSLTTAKAEFQDYNHIHLPTPTIQKAFWTRLASPLVVLQLFGKLLAALEDPSLLHTGLSISQTMVHHYWNARQSIVSAQELAQEVQNQDSTAIKIKVKRGSKNNKWITLNANNLLPGDVFLIQDRMVMPVDALIVKGSAVANEAVLTGESVAQSKVALEPEDDNLDMQGRHRSSVLFAGTSILHCPAGPLTLLALRTGSYSSRGDLLRALQRSRVGAVSNLQTERDGLRLMASLGVVAFISCTYFWISTVDDSTVSVFRKVLQCSRILLAAIPTHLPLALSAIAHTAAMRLKREADVVCSEPGSLLSASMVDHVLFDKTGTLTADTQSLSHVLNATNCTDLILAGSHSLVQVENELVGDPLDLASLRASNWILNKEKGTYHNKDGASLWQIKTFPFDANRRTSSSLVVVQDSEGSFRVYKLLKGSPDAIQDLVSVNKDSFGDTVTQLGQEGYRIIAMGIHDITDNTTIVEKLFPSGFPNATTSTTKAIKKAKKIAQTMLHRDSVETGTFDFCGFSCFEAAVRPSTPRVIDELQQAQIGVTMLTGDGVDAAVSVARRCRIIPDSADVAVVDWDAETSTLLWKRIGGTDNSKISTRSILSNKKSYALVATGSAVEAMTKSTCTSEEKMLQSKLHTFSIFARASPKQKVIVASALKQNGKRVLMCGKLASLYCSCLPEFILTLYYYI